MKKINIDSLDFEKADGLVAAVVQDCDSGTVLMLGFQNREACEKTAEIGRVVFWSRTKGRLWMKGEESGNVLEVLEARIDCDRDTVLYLVKAPEATCHKGDFSCFGNGDSFGVLPKLFQLIQSRKNEMPEGAYTTSLFTAGTERIAQKVGEEAVETVIAALVRDRESFVSESADLIFHWLALLAAKDVSLEEALGELKKRGKSSLPEMVEGS